MESNFLSFDQKIFWLVPSLSLQAPSSPRMCCHSAGSLPPHWAVEFKYTIATLITQFNFICFNQLWWVFQEQANPTLLLLLYSLTSSGILETSIKPLLSMRKQFRICRDGREAILKVAFSLFVFRMEQCDLWWWQQPQHFHAKPHSSATMSFTQFFSLSASILRYWVHEVWQRLSLARGRIFGVLFSLIIWHLMFCIFRFPSLIATHEITLSSPLSIQCWSHFYFAKQ